MTVETQAQLEAELLAYQQAEARHTVRVMKAIVNDAISLQEINLDALRAKVKLINDTLDGDEQTEGFQIFAALSQKLNTVEATANNNTAAIAALQLALAEQIATLGNRIAVVETEGRDARAALDARITTLASQYTTFVADQLQKQTEQDQAIADHKTRIEALESAKALHELRLAQLEADNTTEKADIAQLKVLLQAQTDALVIEKNRAQAAEDQLRAELATERGRIDTLSNQSVFFATRQNVADANKAGAMTYCNTLWAEAGLPMPSGLGMPDGTVSP